jgi:hypothetical protein
MKKAVCASTHPETEVPMATAKQRPPRRRRHERSRRIEPEVAAIQALLGAPGPERTLNRLVAEQEVAFHAARPPLSAAAARLRATWDREGKALGKQFVDVVARWDRGWTTLLDFHFPPRELLHVFGPDRTGTGGDDFYALEWTHIDPFAGTGSFARADRRTGLMGAGHFTTSGWLRSFAGVGVRIVPKTGIGVLSVRPYVNWSGNDLLQHRVFDPQLGEERWAVALGRVGIIVQSKLLAGGDFRTDAIQWQDVWRRAELNPQGASDHDGTVGSATGLMLEVPAIAGRRYVVWVTCNANVFADPGFAVATRASAAISCAVPFLVVEEKPA